MTEQVNQNIESREAPKLKVLFVDDEPEYCAQFWEIQMRKSPVKNNFDVSYLSKFRNAEEAAEEVLKNNPDVVFMDNDLKRAVGVIATGSDVVRSLRGAGFAGLVIGNSSSGAKPFEKAGVAGMMDGFLPDKSLGLRDFLEHLISKQQEHEQ